MTTALNLPENWADYASGPSLKVQRAALGDLSDPEKMPDLAFNIPAQACRVGKTLAAIEGTPCFGCYALKGRYRFANVQNAMDRRLAILNEALSDRSGDLARRWVANFASVLNGRWDRAKRKASKMTETEAGKYLGKKAYFRWHDSGDIQSLGHLVLIALVAKATPEISHWLPTQERKDVRAFMKQYGEFPENLCVRISAAKNDAIAKRETLPQSVVVTSAEGDALVKDSGGSMCPAYELYNGECGPCRSCWDKSNPVTGYPLHN